MPTTAHPAGFAPDWQVPDPSRMSPLELAGQMTQIQVPGQACTPETAAFLARYRVGSVILFSGNVATPAQAAAFTRGLQEAAVAAGLPPLLLAIDQEGGAASVVQQGVSHPPFLMGIGASGDPAFAEAAGRVLAREVRAMGFHWLFAPVLDVNCNPANPVIGPRSFGSDPNLVASMGAAFVQAVQAEGVLACGKHFPGHGDTSLDSHLALPVLPHDRDRLEAVELWPFWMAMAVGLGSLMTAHVVFPAIEPEGVPATLSRRVLTGLLREEMGYDGLVITDSMVMNAIKEHYGTAEAAVRAVLAGADMVMALGDLDRAATTIEALAAAIADGTIPRERAEESVRRVLAAKDRYLREGPAAREAAGTGGEAPRRGHGYAAAWEQPGGRAAWVQPGDVSVCDSAEHRAVVEVLCQAAVRPVNGELPRLRAGERVLVLAPERVERPMSLDFSSPLADLVAALQSRGVRAEGRDTGMDPDPQRVAALVQGADGFDAVLVCCTEKAALPDGLRALADRLEGHPGRAMISMGSPYPVAEYPVAVCCHGRFRPSCEALARVLTGEGARGADPGLAGRAETASTPDEVGPADHLRVRAVRVEPDPPDDLIDFWAEVVAELNATPLDLELRLLDPDAGRGEWYATSLGGRRIGGTFTIPPGPWRSLRPQWVRGHGYGIPQGSEPFVVEGDPEWITVTVDVRGYGRSRQAGDPGIPGWAVHGIEDRRGYILRGAVADFIRAAEVARSLPGADPSLTLLTGGSMAGGLALLAAPWIRNLMGVVASVPTFGAYHLRERLVKRGSGAEVNRLLAAVTPEERAALVENLRYFDVVNVAPLIWVPALIGLGVLDDVVPGETVAAIYHALGSSVKRLQSYPCSHSTHPLDRLWDDFARLSLAWGRGLVAQRRR